MRHCCKWNEDWTFCKCPESVPDVSAEAFGSAVTVPHTWYRDGEYYRGNALYQKKFVLSLGRGEHAYLRFAGVDKVCTVYLNGRRIGAHEGGYTAFAVELTDALLSGCENLLSVVVNNEVGETVSPLSGDFASYGGIYRDVELIVTPSVHFPVCFFGTAGVLARARMQEADGVLHVEIPSGDCAWPDGTQVQYLLLDAQGAAAAEYRGDLAEPAELTVPSVHRWNGLADPYCYRLLARLCSGDEIFDEVELSVGFRSIAVDPEKGFFLNGTPLKLHGVAKHQDTDGVFSAARQEHWRRDMELIREIGANAVRLSHYPHPQPMYELCDREGLVVWSEIPMLKMTLNDALLENAKLQLKEMILQNLHHPSVCFWGLQNEVAIFGDKPYMAQRVAQLNDLAHKLDPDRLTTVANLNTVAFDSGLNHVSDVVAYNVYFGWYYGRMKDHAAFLDEFHQANPTVPLAISEYGADCNPVFHSDVPQVNDYSEEFQALYHETVYPPMAQRDFVWGSFVWNMFDFVSVIRNAAGVKARNLKGLVSFDRKLRKDSFYYYKAMWSSEPFVQIAQKRYVRRAGETMTVKVYSNRPQVSLSANGIVRTEPVRNGSAVFSDVSLQPGENRMTAHAGECSDEASFLRVSEPDPSYIFVDENPGLNVRNWFVDEAEEARLFPEDAYSLRDTLATLLRSAEVVELVKRMQPSVLRMMQEAPDTFTLEQVLRHEKPDIPDDEIKEMNLAMTKISKPQA